ncbi:unnamed protein product [Sphagnum balticum]
MEGLCQQNVGPESRDVHGGNMGARQIAKELDLSSHADAPHISPSLRFFRMEQKTVEAFAKKSLAFLKNATKSGVAAVSQSIDKVRKGYATKHEESVMNELRAKGLHPAEHLHAALRRFNYLYLAGYKHEVHAASLQSAKRLTDGERSTVPLDAILVLGTAMSDEVLKYGDFEKGKLLQGMQDLMNNLRMGKEHYDRDSLSHDVYYAILFIAEEYEGDLHALEQICREVVAHVVTTAPMSDITAVPTTGDPYAEPRRRAAKAIFYFATAVNTAAQEKQEKQLKALKEAETIIQLEQERSKYE